jgi:hypothetical protein
MEEEPLSPTTSSKIALTKRKKEQPPTLTSPLQSNGASNKGGGGSKKRNEHDKKKKKTTKSTVKTGFLMAAIKKSCEKPEEAGFLHDKNARNSRADVENAHVSEIKKIDNALRLRSHTAAIVIDMRRDTMTTTTTTPSPFKPAIVAELENFVFQESGLSYKEQKKTAGTISGIGYSASLKERGNDEDVSNHAFRRIMLYPTPDWRYSLLHCFLYYEGLFESDKKTDFNEKLKDRGGRERESLSAKRVNLDRAKALRKEIYECAIKCRYEEKDASNVIDILKTIDSRWEGNFSECVKRCMSFGLQQASAVLQNERWRLNSNRPGAAQTLLSIARPQFELKCPRTILELKALMEELSSLPTLEKLFGDKSEEAREDALSSLYAYLGGYFEICRMGRKEYEENAREIVENETIKEADPPDTNNPHVCMENLRKVFSKRNETNIPETGPQIEGEDRDEREETDDIVGLQFLSHAETVDWKRETSEGLKNVYVSSRDSWCSESINYSCSEVLYASFLTKKYLGCEEHSKRDDLFMAYCYAYLKGVTVYVLYLDQHTRCLEVCESIVPPKKNDKTVAPLYLIYCKGRYEVMKAFYVGKEKIEPILNSLSTLALDSTFLSEKKKSSNRTKGNKKVVLSVNCLDPASPKGKDLSGELLKYVQVMSKKLYTELELKRTFDGFLSGSNVSKEKDSGFRKVDFTRTNGVKTGPTLAKAGGDFILFYKNDRDSEYVCDEEEEEEEEEDEEKKNKTRRTEVFDRSPLFASIVPYLKIIYTKDSCRMAQFGCKGRVLKEEEERRRIESLRKKGTMSLLQGSGAVKSGRLTSYDPFEETKSYDDGLSTTTTTTTVIKTTPKNEGEKIEAKEETKATTTFDKNFVYKIIIKNPSRLIWTCKTVNKKNETRVSTPATKMAPDSIASSKKKKEFCTFFILLDDNTDEKAYSFSPSLFECKFVRWNLIDTGEETGDSCGKTHYKKKLEVKDGYYGSRAEAIRLLEKLESVSPAIRQQGSATTTTTRRHESKSPFELAAVKNLHLKTAMVFSCFGRFEPRHRVVGLSGYEKEEEDVKTISCCVRFIQELAALVKIKACYLTGNNAAHFSEIQVTESKENTIRPKILYDSGSSDLKLVYSYDTRKYYSVSFWAGSGGGGGSINENSEDQLLDSLFGSLFIGDVEKVVHNDIANFSNFGTISSRNFGFRKNGRDHDEDDDDDDDGLALEASKCQFSSNDSRTCGNCMDCCEMTENEKDDGKKKSRRNFDLEDLLHWYVCLFEKSKITGINHLRSGKNLDIRIPLPKKKVGSVQDQLFDSRIVFTDQYAHPWYESVLKTTTRSSETNSSSSNGSSAFGSGYLGEVLNPAVGTMNKFLSFLEDDDDDEDDDGNTRDRVVKKREPKPSSKGRSKKEVQLADSECYKKISFVKGVLFVVLFPKLQILESLPSYEKASLKRKKYLKTFYESFYRNIVDRRYRR